MLRFTPYLLTLGIAFVTCVPAARGEVPWLESIDQARQVAAQTNRLVLVHFWSKDCQPCMRMEQSVFAKPGTAERIQSRYVPVKVNSQQFPAVARQFDVTFLPCDIVLAPNGQVVASLRCSLDQETYLAGLDQVAVAADPRLNNAYSNLGAAPAAPPAGSPALGTQQHQPTLGAVPQAAAASAPATVSTGDRYADYFLQRQQQPPAASIQPPPSQPGLMPSPAMASHVGHPGPAAPPPGAQVPTMPPTVSPGSSGAPMAPSVAGQATPALAVDGYCTVELAERERWVRGDARYGAVHRGQTYLFAGPEQQQKFLANPDRYGLAMSGFDPILALEKRQLVPGIRKYGMYYDNRIYVFSSEATLQQFWSAAPRYADGVRLAEAGGPTVR